MLTIILDSSQLIISLTLCHTQQLCNLVYLPCPWFQLIPPPTEKKQASRKVSATARHSLFGLGKSSHCHTMNKKYSI